jgi:hypothetical protein
MFRRFSLQSLWLLAFWGSFFCPHHAVISLDGRLKEAFSLSIFAIFAFFVAIISFSCGSSTVLSAHKRALSRSSAGPSSIQSLKTKSLAGKAWR